MRRKFPKQKELAEIVIKDIRSAPCDTECRGAGVSGVNAYDADFRGATVGQSSGIFRMLKFADQELRAGSASITLDDVEI